MLRYHTFNLDIGYVGNDIILIPLGIEDTWSEVVKKVETLDNRKPAIVVCATGFRSKIFSSFLSRSGFDKVCCTNS